MPLTSSSTESSRLSPRTRLGFGAEGSGSVAGEAVSIVVGRLRCWSLVVSRLSFGSAPLDTARICERPTTSDQRQVLSHAQFVRRFQRRSAAAADDGQAIAAGKGIADLHRADWTVQHRRGFLGVRRCFRSDFHGLELCARNCNTIPGGARASLILARQDAAELRSAGQPGAAVPTKCLTGAACAGSGRLRSVAVKWEIARLCLSSRD